MNVTKITSGVITSVIIALHDLLPMVGLGFGMATSDASGCNWVSYCPVLNAPVEERIGGWNVYEK